MFVVIIQNNGEKKNDFDKISGKPYHKHLELSIEKKFKLITIISNEFFELVVAIIDWLIDEIKKTITGYREAKKKKKKKKALKMTRWSNFREKKI